MKFEEFLEQEKKLVESYHSAPSFHGKLSEYISFKRNIGNWAWDELLKHYWSARDGGLFDFFDCEYDIDEMIENVKHHSNLCVELEQAVGCLGKDEIKRRLEKLKGDNNG